jgi:hypothetical protein
MKTDVGKKTKRKKERKRKKSKPYYKFTGFRGRIIETPSAALPGLKTCECAVESEMKHRNVKIIGIHLTR